jgi:hypothetical protein
MVIERWSVAHRKCKIRQTLKQTLTHSFLLSHLLIMSRWLFPCLDVEITTLTTLVTPSCFPTAKVIISHEICKQFKVFNRNSQFEWWFINNS